ncbi:hypothetical protein DOTSEDRAFT_72640 [Dothistroma septosporum NZE10]|uniref:Uncharacterized protein n=1 Tax=Dothistroma septosporum (strain NZE10 / CBS 128990) TaxID=675120 RepID=M2WMQ1_DOTSN|nr:hypothetical protein DOTSEDRAFT_72640 [Dothistroma septosporum NZE10]
MKEQLQFIYQQGQVLEIWEKVGSKCMGPDLRAPQVSRGLDPADRNSGDDLLTQRQGRVLTEVLQSINILEPAGRAVKEQDDDLVVPQLRDHKILVCLASPSEGFPSFGGHA